QSKRALVLLERALALDPTCALAHAFAAECHHSIFLREGMREEHRIASMRHAEAAITYRQDDATALTFAGFTIGMEGRDRATALSLFEQALSVSPSSAHTYICGSIVLAFGGQANALFNGLSAPYASVHLIHGVRQLIWHLRWGTFIAVAIRMRLLPDGKLCRPVQVSVLHT
ncbi:MAG: hypothetical protein WAV78_29840, partial [Xanthobacteraceae bacterium]